jgi:hypothetical protein
MAVHAGLGRRKTRETRRFDARVAVTAVEPLAADMMLMAERNRLVTRHVLASQVVRQIQLISGPTDKTNDENRAKNRRAREGVATSMKDLGHNFARAPRTRSWLYAILLWRYWKTAIRDQLSTLPVQPGIEPSEKLRSR